MNRLTTCGFGKPGAASTETVVQLSSTSDAGGWNSVPSGALHTVLDDASTTDYIECMQGMGMSDDCDVRGSAPGPATAVRIEYMTWSNTTTAATVLFKNSLGGNIIQDTAPTVTPSTWTLRTIDLTGAELPVFNMAPGFRMIPTTAISSTNRIAWFRATITH